MARRGNHGQVIPRRGRLMYHLYVEEGWTQTQIGELLHVNHRSVGNVLRELGIEPRRSGPPPKAKCIRCGGPVYRIRHTTSGYEYGRMCKQHWDEHRKSLSRRYFSEGPVNPTTDGQWINKGKALLRRARKLLDTANPPASLSQSGASEQDSISPI